MAIVSLIQSNHDINFILSSVKALALIYYIIKYATKGDYSQYQKIMITAIIKKTFENQNKPGLRLLFYTPILDTFSLKAFNKLLHDYEVSKPLIARFLWDLPNHYTPNALVKLINISMLKTKFPLLISGQNFNILESIAYVNSIKMQSYSIFEHYHHKSLCFMQLSLYKYYRIVLVVKRERKQEKDYKFDDIYI